MKRSEVELHLQTLFRNKNTRHTEALCCFFTNGEYTDELFPKEVITKKHGTWTFSEFGNDRQPDGKFKTWAKYERIIEEPEEDASGDSGE